MWYINRVFIIYFLLIKCLIHRQLVLVCGLLTLSKEDVHVLNTSVYNNIMKNRIISISLRVIGIILISLVSIIVYLTYVRGTIRFIIEL